jgi:hypothetical protein
MSIERERRADEVQEPDKMDQRGDQSEISPSLKPAAEMSFPSPAGLDLIREELTRCDPELNTSVSHLQT